MGSTCCLEGPNKIINEGSMMHRRNLLGGRRSSNLDSGGSGGSGSSGGDTKFKSKNLNAERRRRAKLSQRLLQLRSSVPFITNMNKETIITDAITYIEQLQGYVRDLSNELHELEATTSKEEWIPKQEQYINASQDMKTWKPEVKVIHMNNNKIWMKIIHEKKFGGFTKLVEAMSTLGFEFTDTCFTSSKGAAVVTSTLEVIQDSRLNIKEMKEFLLTFISRL